VPPCTSQIIKRNAGNTAWECADDDSGGGSLSVIQVNSNQAIGTSNAFVNINAAYTVTLPSSPTTGQILYFHVYDKNAIINPNGKTFRQQGVDYTSSQSFNANAMNANTLTIIYDGNKWIVIGLLD